MQPNADGETVIGVVNRRGRGGRDDPDRRRRRRACHGVLIITILSNGMTMIGVDPYRQNIAKGVVLAIMVFVAIDRAKIGVTK
jgi:hypothetical protein